MLDAVALFCTCTLLGGEYVGREQQKQQCTRIAHQVADSCHQSERYIRMDGPYTSLPKKKTTYSFTTWTDGTTMKAPQLLCERSAAAPRLVGRETLALLALQLSIRRRQSPCNPIKRAACWLYPKIQLRPGNYLFLYPTNTRSSACTLGLSGDDQRRTIKEGGGSGSNLRGGKGGSVFNCAYRKR